MKCKSCNEDVPPKFTHALAVNICPLCGKEIMDTKLQNILGELKTAFSSAQEYMEAVEDWLLSNYSLKKIKPNEVVVDKNQLKAPRPEKPGPSATPAHGSPVMVNRKDDDEDSQEEIVIDEQPSVWAKRSGVIHPKKALDFIKGKASLGAADPSEFQGMDEEYGDMEEPSMQNLNPLSANEANQMAAMFKGNDLGKASQELEMQKLKRLQASSNIAGGSGFIRRT